MDQRLEPILRDSKKSKIRTVYTLEIVVDEENSDLVEELCEFFESSVRPKTKEFTSNWKEVRFRDDYR